MEAVIMKGKPLPFRRYLRLPDESGTAARPDAEGTEERNQRGREGRLWNLATGLEIQGVRHYIKEAVMG